MRKIFARAVIAGALAVAMWPAAQANAACTNIANADGSCKAQYKCVNTIVKNATAYVTKVQASVTKGIANSTAGKLIKVPLYKCIGSARNTKVCLSNADCGTCVGGTKAGKACTAATAATDCPGGTCPSAGQCQPNSAKDDFSKDTEAAKTGLTKAILGACCAAKCVGGSKAGKSCSSDANCPTSTCACSLGVTAADLGLDAVDICPAVADAANDLKAFQAISDCVQQGTVGPKKPTENAPTDTIDATNGSSQGPTVGDATFSVFTKLLGTGSTILRPHGQNNTDPRMVDQVSGSQLLQIGSGGSKPSVSAGGSVTYLSLAHCVGGNAAKSCLNDSDCGVAPSPTGTCTTNCTGDSCDITGPKTDINLLTVTSSCSSGLGQCLVTSTVDSGNGTPADGTINLKTGETTNSAPISTQVWITGIGVDCNSFVGCPVCLSKVCTGVCSGDATQACTSDAGCTASASSCSANGGACTAPDGATTQECLPVFDRLASSTSPTAVIPNPFNLGTGSAEMEIVASTATGDGEGDFCGFCDMTTGSPTSGCDHGAGADAVCANGCQTDADCVARVNTGGNTGRCDLAPNTQCTVNTDCSGGATGPCDPLACKFTKSSVGFNGSPTVNKITALGEANPYTPTLVGVFCTGSTGSGLVDGSAGIPGPVRITIPYVQLYRFPTPP